MKYCSNCGKEMICERCPNCVNIINNFNNTFNY